MANEIVRQEFQYLSTLPSLANTEIQESLCDNKGAQLVNPGVPSTAPGQTNVSVGTTSTNILASNANRAALWFYNNDSTNPVYIVFGAGPAAAGAPSIKVAAGAAWPTNGPLTGWVPNTAVYGITTTGVSAVSLTVLEG